MSRAAKQLLKATTTLRTVSALVLMLFDCVHMVHAAQAHIANHSTNFRTWMAAVNSAVVVSA
jgi:hypothetical protein